MAHSIALLIAMALSYWIGHAVGYSLGRDAARKQYFCKWCNAYHDRGFAEMFRGGGCE